MMLIRTETWSLTVVVCVCRLICYWGILYIAYCIAALALKGRMGVYCGIYTLGCWQKIKENSRTTFPKQFYPRNDLPPFFRPPGVVFAYLIMCKAKQSVRGVWLRAARGAT